jgi:hypothetical protein
VPPSPYAPTQVESELPVPRGWSELPAGVLRTFTAMSYTNLHLAPTTASRILAALPKGAQLTETLQCSLLPTTEVWRHVRYGSILGCVQTAVLQCVEEILRTCRLTAPLKDFRPYP